MILGYHFRKPPVDHLGFGASPGSAWAEGRLTLGKASKPSAITSKWLSINSINHQKHSKTGGFTDLPHYMQISSRFPRSVGAKKSRAWEVQARASQTLRPAWLATKHPPWNQRRETSWGLTTLTWVTYEAWSSFQNRPKTRLTWKIFEEKMRLEPNMPAIRVVVAKGPHSSLGQSKMTPSL